MDKNTKIRKGDESTKGVVDIMGAQRHSGSIHKRTSSQRSPKIMGIQTMETDKS